MRGGDRLDRILELVRERGGRVTGSRRAVVAALLASERHLTATDLTEAVQRAHPDIAESTVYRTLDLLSGLGVVEHVHLGHGPAVYHLADDRHQHLVCSECGRVVEVPATLLDGVAAEVKADHGFVLDTRHFAFAGRCLTCRR